MVVGNVQRVVRFGYYVLDSLRHPGENSRKAPW